MYVDDFVYYSTFDEVEEWFKQGLQLEIKVDFMGTVSWFIGQAYEWYTTSNGQVTCQYRIRSVYGTTTGEEQMNTM